MRNWQEKCREREWEEARQAFLLSGEPLEAHVTMEVKPLRVVPSSDDTAEGGCGSQKKIDTDRKIVEGIEEDSSVTLGLGSGAYSASAINPIIPKKPLLTETQRRELLHQAFIFKHFVYNLPVPHHLVLPILKSVAATSEPGFGSICDQFPTILGFSHKGFGYANMNDHEPHRCRRTDGKKWRCKEKVVPNQKYCERHMHRGRNRSRKPVETSEVNSSSPKPFGKLSSSIKSAVPDSNSLGIQLIKTSICTPSSHRNFDTSATDRCKSSLGSPAGFSPATTISNITSVADSKQPFGKLSSSIKSAVPDSNPLGIQLIKTSICTPSSHRNFDTSATDRCKSSLGSPAGFSPATTISNITSVASNDKSNLNFFRKDDYANSCVRHNNGVRSSGIRNIINDSNISTGIGISPRSVLQGYTVPASYQSLLIDPNKAELEPGRCRRTDGKRWRCRRAVLPHQKYCATHMHRGAKRRFTDHEPLPSPAAIPSIQKAHCTIPNTNLSMSIPASAPFVQSAEKSRSSSVTDTTISDTMNDSYASFSEAASKLQPV